MGSGYKRVRSKDVESLATDLFDSFKKGITVSHLVTKFCINKQHARRIIKRCLHSQVLFAPEKHKPQQYFPMKRRPQVIEYLYASKRLPIQPAGITSSCHPLFNALEYQKATNILDILRFLPLSPKFTHNLHMKTSIDRKYYDDIRLPLNAHTKGKSTLERIGLREVEYTYYPSGSTMMEVTSNSHPFRVGSQDDINILFSFFGQIRGWMVEHLDDPRERIVPHINDWTLKQCDINVDIELTDLGQITLPDIQISTFSRVFRAYVKIIESNAFYRLEETLALDSPLLKAFDSIVHPNRELEKLVNKLIDTIRLQSRGCGFCNNYTQFI